MSNQASILAEPKKLIISIGEARKIMGKDAKGLSDDQIEKLIVDYAAITKQYFREASIDDKQTG